MLWLINQATAGEISGQSIPPAPPDAAKTEEKKEGIFSAAGGASFNTFKIDMNA
jgi:hypothetical protein